MAIIKSIRPRRKPAVPTPAKAPAIAAQTDKAQQPAALSAAADAPGRDEAESSLGRKLAPSSKHLEALDLATRSGSALRVPVMPVSDRSRGKKWEDVLLYATRHSATEIQDSLGNAYILGPIIGGGVSSKVRYITKPDPLVPQNYVAKEIARSEFSPPAPAWRGYIKSPVTPTDTAAGNATMVEIPPHSAETAVIVAGQTNVEHEVTAMLETGSPLAPHVVLRTQDRDFLLMPVLAFDMFRVWTAASHNYKMYESFLPRALFIAGEAALRPIHAAGLFHGDMKPENFLGDRIGDIYLGDFGLTARIEDSAPRGSPGYLPPEAFMMPDLLKKPYDGAKADIWGNAAAAVAVMTGKNFLWPFATKNTAEGTQKSAAKIIEAAELILAYKTSWTAHATWAKHGYAAKLRPRFAPANQGPQAAQDYMSELFQRVRAADPPLFIPLLKALHPDASKRRFVNMDMNAGVSGEASARLLALLRSIGNDNPPGPEDEPLPDPFKAAVTPKPNLSRRKSF